jgi:precorrin-2/cobalt-factor-2 C20-methyltransferase
MGELGTLYGLSVGPGDPELLTLKAWRILQRVTVVAFPAGKANQTGIAETIIAPYLQPQQIRLPLVFPYVLDRQILDRAWQEAREAVWAYLCQGIDVAFACEGDISFYSTFSHLAQALSSQDKALPIVRVPGVSIPMTVASALGMPLTTQAQRLAIIPALYYGQELELALDWAEVVVLLKFRQVYPRVWRILEQRQLLEQAWIIEWASTPQQKIYHPLTAYPQLKLTYFSTLLIKVAHSSPTLGNQG